jgi:hypothetical protein
MLLQGGIQGRAVVNDDIIDIEYGFGDMAPIRTAVDQDFILIRFDRKMAFMNKNFVFHKSTLKN